MANEHELEVDPHGMRTAATNSEATARALTNAGLAEVTTSQPSGKGVDAVNAAVKSAQRRQSQRITDQANDMSTGAAAYSRTDSEGSDAITAVQV